MSAPTSSDLFRLPKRTGSSGQSSVEYLLMLAFITLVAIGILSATGNSVKNLLGGVTSSLQGAFQVKPPANSSPSP